MATTQCLISIILAGLVKSKERNHFDVEKFICHNAINNLMVDIFSWVGLVSKNYEIERICLEMEHQLRVYQQQPTSS